MIIANTEVKINAGMTSVNKHMCSGPASKILISCSYLQTQMQYARTTASSTIVGTVLSPSMLPEMQQDNFPLYMHTIQ